MRDGFSYSSMVGPSRVGASCVFEGPDFGYERREILLLERGSLSGLSRVSRGHGG